MKEYIALHTEPRLRDERWGVVGWLRGLLKPRMERKRVLREDGCFAVVSERTWILFFCLVPVSFSTKL